MTEKQKRFADYYIETGIGSEAYRRAYKSCKKEETARVNASRLLTNANIRAYIDTEISKKDSKRIAKQEEVLEYLTKVMRGEVNEEVVVVVGKGDGISSASNIEKQVAAKEQLKAAELLGKRYGIFTENHNLTGDGVIKIINNIPRSDGK